VGRVDNWIQSAERDPSSTARPLPTESCTSHDMISGTYTKFKKLMTRHHTHYLFYPGHPVQNSRSSLTTSPPSLYYLIRILAFDFLPSYWSVDFFTAPPSTDNWARPKSANPREIHAPPSPPCSLTHISLAAGNSAAKRPSRVLSSVSILSYSPVTQSSRTTIFRLPPFAPHHLLWIYFMGLLYPNPHRHS
jgi:hypothetical protein